MSELRVAPSRWRWLILIGGVVAVIFGIGWFTLRDLRSQGQAAVRADLTSLIFAEETVRANGDRAAAEKLINPNAPQVWREAYWQAFERGSADVGLVTITALDFDGQCAVVDVTLGRVDQVRGYCLTDAGWQRTPVPASAWGTEQTEIIFPTGASLRFHERDRTFAEALAPALTPAFETLAKTFPTDTRLSQVEISLEPRDLAGPLIQNSPDRIVLNSPQLATADDNLSRDAAVRLALAKSLLPPKAPSAFEQANPPPGAARFRQAGHTVAAMYLLLLPESRAVLQTRWRDTVGEQWESPLIAYPNAPPDGPTEEQLMASAHLMADYVVQQWGLPTLLALIKQLPTVYSWDQFFQSGLGRTAIRLDSEAASYTRAGLKDLSTVWRGEEVSPSSVALPPTMTFLERGEVLSSRDHLFGEISGQSEPILIESTGPIHTAAAGAAVPVACLPPGSTLAIDGQWLEIHRRIQSNRLTVQEIGTLAIELAPANTVAYLVDGQLYDEQNPEAERTVYPGTSAYLVARRAKYAQALLALDDTGHAHHLTWLSPTLEVFSLPTSPADGPQFLFRRDLPDCKRSWLIHYHPRRGVIDQWLSPPRPMQWVWQPHQKRPLFFKYGGTGTIHGILRPVDSVSLEAVSRTRFGMQLLGWHRAQERLVAKNSALGETFVGLLDWQSGLISRLAQPYYHGLRTSELSVDGNWLAHAEGIQNMLGPPDRIDVLNLTSGKEHTLFQLEPQQGLGWLRWSVDPDQPTLITLTGPVTEAGDDFHPIKLVALSPDRPKAGQVMAEVPGNQSFAAPILCADGSAMVRVQRAEGRRRLQHYPLAGQMALLFETGQPFWPLAC